MGLNRTTRAAILLVGLVVPVPNGVSAAASEQEAVEAFYAERESETVWTEESGASVLNPMGEIVVQVMAQADRDGLEVDAYRVDLSSDNRATLDRSITRTLVRYLTDLQAGRVEPRKADPDLFVYARDVDALAALNSIAESETPKRALLEMAPSNPVYRRLRRLLAEYRTLEQDGGWGTVPDGPSLKPGMQDLRIEAVRARLRVSSDLTIPSDDNALYGPSLEIAVRSFQQRHGLEPDGAIGAKTVAAMNVSVGDRIRQIKINLERFRWMPDDFGDDHVFVNMAGFELDYIRRGSIAYRMRVVVGRQYRETPVFSDRIRYLEVNPTWTVPPKIASNDLLPKIIADPSYLTAGGYEVLSGWDAGASVLNPSQIDWAQYNGGRFPYKLRQAPGKANALGRVKFMFPNPFDIYLHDTPARELFRRTVRTFSSGCIRLERPIELAEFLLAADGQDPNDLTAILASGKTTRLNLATPVPVHLTYLTAWIGEGGTIEFRDDVYGRDALLAQALGF